MHEPIVSKELFDKVQDILSARQSEQGLATIYDSKSKRRSMFKGILRCGECGRSMYLRSKSNRGYYYYCTLHENYNATICPKKAVKQEDVESLALRLIQTQIRAFSDAQRLIANLNATPSSQTRYQIYETQIDDAKRKIEKFNQLKAALYGDFADGLLSHQDYTDLSEDYSRRADDLRIFIAELEKEKEKLSSIQTELDANTNMTRRLQSRKAELYEQYRAGRISREKFADIQKTDSEKLARLSSRAEEIKRLLVEHYESRGNLAAGKRTADQIILLKDYDPEIIRNFVERVRVYPSGEIEIDMRTSSGFEFVTAS